MTHYYFFLHLYLYPNLCTVLLSYISFVMDCLDLLAFQVTLKNLLQHHNSKASILSAQLLTVQLSHPNMTTGETIALTRQTFTSKEMSLLYNMLSRLVIAFLSRSKCLNFMAAVTVHGDFGAQENKICQSPCFPCLFALVLMDFSLFSSLL